MSEVKCGNSECNNKPSANATICQACGHQVTFATLEANRKLKKRLKFRRYVICFLWFVVLVLGLFQFDYFRDQVKELGQSAAKVANEKIKVVSEEKVVKPAVTGSVLQQSFDYAQSQVLQENNLPIDAELLGYDANAVKPLKNGRFKIKISAKGKDDEGQLVQNEYVCVVKVSDLWELESITTVSAGDYEEEK